MQGFNDLRASLVTIALVALSWGLALLFKRLGTSTRLTRNFLHFVAGLWGLLWLLFQNQYIAVLFTLLGILALFLVLFGKRVPFFNLLSQPFSCDHHGKWGVLLFALSLFLVTFLLWEKKAQGTAVIFALALGDGLAEAIGCRWGKTFFPLPWNRKKTLEGSLACLLGAALAISFGFWITGSRPPFYLSLAGGAICALVE
ncbi:MAG: hypothetical protein ACPL7L_04950, partial [bacterium]